MNRLDNTRHNLQRRKFRIRRQIEGTPERPRLSVFVSNRHISAQIIDDSVQKTLVAVTTVGSKSGDRTMTDKAVWVGAQLAKKAKQAQIKTVVFDRNGKLYHGRVKALADAARTEGLEF